MPSFRRIVARLMQSLLSLDLSALLWVCRVNSATGCSCALASTRPKKWTSWRPGRPTRKLSSLLSLKMERSVSSTCFRQLCSSSLRDIPNSQSLLPHLWSYLSVIRMFSLRNSSLSGSTKKLSLTSPAHSTTAKLRSPSVATSNPSWNGSSK